MKLSVGTFDLNHRSFVYLAIPVPKEFRRKRRVELFAEWAETKPCRIISIAEGTGKQCYACGGKLGERAQCLKCWKATEGKRRQTRLERAALRVLDILTGTKAEAYACDALNDLREALPNKRGVLRREG